METSILVTEWQTVHANIDETAFFEADELGLIASLVCAALIVIVVVE